MVEKSTHKCEVVELNFQKHPNADLLSVTPVWGYSYVGNTKEWEGVTLGVFIPPDSLVDTTLPEFMGLASEAKYAADSTKGGVYARVRAKKLRGIVSYGYMIPAPEGTKVGDDLTDQLKVLHYDPPLRGSNSGSPMAKLFGGGEVESPPSVYTVKYDVDAFQRYARVMFVENEPVHVTEKIHGENGRWVFHDGRMYCGSRTEWKREYAKIPVPELGTLVNLLGERICKQRKVEWLTDDEIILLNEKAKSILEGISKKNSNPKQNLWWKALAQHPELRDWCEEHPDVVVYGEVYGSVQNLQYGIPQGEVRIAVFDLLVNGTWMDAEAARLAGPELPWVPVVATNFPFNFDALVAFAEGRSLIKGANNIREGVVVKPMLERYFPCLGRVNLKIISLAYLEMK